MKKIKKALPIIVVLSLVLSISAYAYSQTLSVTFSSDGTKGSFVNRVESNAPKQVLSYLEVGMYVYEEYFGTVVYDNYTNKENPTSSSLGIGYSHYDLPAGTYTNEGYGVVQYYSPFDTDNETIQRTRVFVHSPEKAASNEEEQTTKFIARGNEILNNFEEYNSDYTCVVNTALCEELGSTEDYINIRRSLNLTAGDTIPVYYINKEEQIIIAVKEDADGIGYKFTFAKDNDGSWSLKDSIRTTD